MKFKVFLTIHSKLAGVVAFTPDSSGRAITQRCKLRIVNPYTFIRLLVLPNYHFLASALWT